jgi:hypothetical protein
VDTWVIAGAGGFVVVETSWDLWLKHGLLGMGETGIWQCCDFGNVERGWDRYWGHFVRL